MDRAACPAAAEKRDDATIRVARSQVNVSRRHHPIRNQDAFEIRILQAVLDAFHVLVNPHRQLATPGRRNRRVLLEPMQAQPEIITAAVVAANDRRNTSGDAHTEYHCRNDELPGHASLRPAWCGYLN
jgi:hypothetical protein